MFTTSLIYWFYDNLKYFKCELIYLYILKLRENKRSDKKANPTVCIIPKNVSTLTHYLTGLSNLLFQAWANCIFQRNKWRYDIPNPMARSARYTSGSNICWSGLNRNAIISFIGNRKKIIQYPNSSLISLINFSIGISRDKSNLLTTIGSSYLV